MYSFSWFWLGALSGDNFRCVPLICRVQQWLLQVPEDMPNVYLSSPLLFVKLRLEFMKGYEGLGTLSGGFIKLGKRIDCIYAFEDVRNSHNLSLSLKKGIRSRP